MEMAKVKKAEKTILWTDLMRVTPDGPDGLARRWISKSRELHSDSDMSKLKVGYWYGLV